jgi:hypothetical protein
MDKPVAQFDQRLDLGHEPGVEAVGKFLAQLRSARSLIDVERPLECSPKLLSGGLGSLGRLLTPTTSTSVARLRSKVCTAIIVAP